MIKAFKGCVYMVLYCGNHLFYKHLSRNCKGFDYAIISVTQIFNLNSKYKSKH